MTLAPFPWKRSGLCELCAAPLDGAVWTIELSAGYHVPGKDGRARTWKAPRVLHVCGRHRGGLTNGRPVAIPSQTMRPGTSQRFPQELRLFDSIPYKTRTSRMGEP